MVSLLSVVNRALTNVERDEGQPEPTVTTDELWDKLGRMFNLESLDMLVSALELSCAELKGPGRWDKPGKAHPRV